MKISKQYLAGVATATVVLVGFDYMRWRAERQVTEQLMSSAPPEQTFHWDGKRKDYVNSLGQTAAERRAARNSPVMRGRGPRSDKPVEYWPSPIDPHPVDPHDMSEEEWRRGWTGGM